MRSVVEDEVAAGQRTGQTAEFGRFFVDVNLVAGARQTVGAGKTGDAAADDSNFFHQDKLVYCKWERAPFHSGNFFRTLYFYIGKIDFSRNNPHGANHVL